MSPPPFLMWPDRRLRSPAVPVDRIDDRIRSIWDEMLEAMYAMPGSGVGLGAPQIGVMEALAVLDCSSGQNVPVRLANPELVWASSSMNVHEEGSPNLPGLFAKVTRPSEVEVRYIDAEGAEVQRRFEGLWATSVQHQMDHLEGRMFFDRLSPLKRKMLLAKHAKAKKWRGG